MKNVIEIIKTRRCVRAYKEDTIPDEYIEILIDCASYAPSGFNLQPWAFLVIKNQDMMRKISDIAKKSLIPYLSTLKHNNKNINKIYNNLNNQTSNIFYNAPVMVVILGKENGISTESACALAAQNMMLAAHSMGIGSCWIGGANFSLQNKELLNELGVPAGYKAVAPLIFGYPESETKMPEKSKPVVIWFR